MKLRNDYVSNSSSSSFIINFGDKGKCIDKKFIQLLKRTKYVCISGDCKTKKKRDELKETVNKVFGDGCASSWEDEEVSIDVDINSENLNPDEPKQVEVIQELLKLKNGNFHCGCGDDFGEEMADAIQTATILECLYKDIEIEGEDHFDYNSIRGTELDDIGTK